MQNLTRSTPRILEHLSRVIGPPGCGKTTQLSKWVRQAYERGLNVMVTSLTRAAAAEIVGRDLPIDQHRIGTLHSHAYRALMGSFTGIADTAKFIDQWNLDYPKFALSGGERDLDEDNASPFEGKAEGDDAYNAMNCFRARRTSEEVWPDWVKSFNNVWTRWKKENDLIDFTDMLEIALDSIPIAPGNPDVIFADESQDFSALEMALLSQWGIKAGRLVIVGDPWQALFSWRGSDPAVFTEGEIPPDNFRLLGQSYRVPKAVHKIAMAWMRKMPDYQPIEYLPTDAEGLASSLDATYKDFANALPVIEGTLKANKTVMILASCAYMLSGVIALLRAEGIPFHNEHRRRNGAWNPLQRRGTNLRSSDRLSAFLRMGEEGFWTKTDLQDWLSAVKCSEVLPTKQSYKKFEPALANLNDGEIPYGLVEAMLGERAVEAGMAGDTSWYMDHLQSSRRAAANFPCAIAKNRGAQVLKEEPRVTVGTIHSVKGGEADVVILAPDLSIRGMESWNSSVEGEASGYRLFYVGMTRAKEALYVMRPAIGDLKAPGLALR